MTHFEVGSKVDIFKGKEGTLFDINEAGEGTGRRGKEIS